MIWFMMRKFMRETNKTVDSLKLDIYDMRVPTHEVVDKLNSVCEQINKIYERVGEKNNGGFTSSF